MKKPKNITICGHDYKVTYNNSTISASGHTGSQTIEIGTKRKERTLNNIIHEAAELIACERDYRYEGYNNGHLIVMNHGEFSIFIDDLACALRPIIK